MEAAGVTSHDELQGKSFFPLVREEGEKPFREAIFAEMTYHVNYLPMRAARTNRWKYIRNYSEDPVGLDQCSHMEWAQKVCDLPNQPWLRPRAPEELYDLQNDAHEQKNLVGEKSYEEYLKKMRSLLDEHMEKTQDPFMGKNLGND
jgi:arylsulfatase A-like enzyme